MTKLKWLIIAISSAVCVTGATVGIVFGVKASRTMNYTISVVSGVEDVKLTAYLGDEKETKLGVIEKMKTGEVVELKSSKLQADDFISNDNGQKMLDVVLELENSSTTKNYGVFILNGENSSDSYVIEDIARKVELDGKLKDETVIKNVVTLSSWGYQKVSANAKTVVKFNLKLNTDEDFELELNIPLVVHEYDVAMDPAFYDSLQTALDVIENSNVGTQAIPFENAKVGVYTDKDDVKNLVLVSNIDLVESVEINSSVKLNLNGRRISSTGDYALVVNADNVVIDGTKEGSHIFASNNVGVSTLKITGTNCKLFAGTYEIATEGIGTDANPNYNVVLAGTATLYAEGVTIISNDKTTGTIVGMFVGENNECELNNCNILSAAPNGMNVVALRNNGETKATNSTFDARANHTANSAGTNYATTSRGCWNYGTLTLKNCHVKGMHSGVTSCGVLYIDGGVYEGYSHGGIYFLGGGLTSYVKNAEIKECELLEGYIDDGVAGTNHAGMYIGGADDIVVYMDNCNLSGVLYPLVMKKGCSGNALYISNSSIDDTHSKYIRLDTTNNTLFIGSGNNFTISDDCYQEAAAQETGVDYSVLFPEY